jgi:hypothetical protein
MKFIISESKIFKPLTKYFNELIESPEFEWIEKIEVQMDDTLNYGWTRSIPLFNYFIYVKPEFNSSPLKLARLEKEIYEKHSLLFPNNAKDQVTAHYSIHLM